MDLVKKSILKAAAATAVVIFFGVLIGLQADDFREGYVQSQLRESSINTQTFLVTQKYLDQSSRNYCKVVENRIPKLSEQNTEIGRNLQSFAGKGISNGNEYKNIRREYYINQLRLYNVLSEYKSRCGQDTTLIFFFFDGSVDSERQGAALTEYYRKVDNSTYIFSYNLETDNSEILDILKSDFDVREGPTIVLNGDRVYRRYLPYKELKREIGSS